MTRKLTIEHRGTTYSGEIGRITSTSLGVEDHGIFSAFLTVEWSGGGVSVGGYALDDWDVDEKRRLGTAYGLDHIAEIMRVVGVERWEHVKGKQIIVLFAGSGGWGSRAVGIANTVDEDKVLVFSEHADWWREREAAKGVDSMSSE